MSRTNILLVTTTGCLHCIRLKKLFTNRKIEFFEVNILLSPLFVDVLRELTLGTTTVPQVFFNSVYIGGLKQILDLVQNGKLEATIQAAAQEPLLAVDPPLNQPLRPQPKSHIKLNPVLESLYTDLRESNFLSKKGKLKFKSSDFIHFMTKQKNKEKADAIKLGLKFQEMGYMYRRKDPEKPFADDSAEWQFTQDKDEHVLNAKLTHPPKVTSPTGEAVDRDPIKIGRSLYEDLLGIIEEHLDETGNISYDKIQSSDAWSLFQNDILELNSMVPIRENHIIQLVVFFSQLYFILYHHILIINKGNCEARKLTAYSYLVNGIPYSLESIALVLRTNRLSPPAKPEDKEKKPSKEKDKKPRKLVSSLHFEPIHSNPDFRTLFAMLSLHLCSPPILFFNLENTDYGLQWNCEALCSEVKVILAKKTEQFFQWLGSCIPVKQEEKLVELLKGNINEIQILHRKCQWEANCLTVMSFMEGSETPRLPPSAGHPCSEEEEEAPEETSITDHQTPQSEELKKETQLRISTAQMNRQHKIILTSCELNEIPSELVSTPFPILKRLECGRNNIVALPKSFSVSLSGITYLFLNYNQLKTIPKPIAQLAQLECLDLSHNAISSIPNQFFTLRDLKQINLNHNKLQSLPLGFPQLRSLEDVGLADNGLTKLPHNFGEMRKMETLDLSNNSISVMPDLSNLDSLTELSLQKNKIQELEFGLIGIRHLVTFNVSHNSISALPMNISRLVYLREFNLQTKGSEVWKHVTHRFRSHNQLYRLPSHICELLSVQKLNLDGNPIADPPEKVVKGGIKEIRNHFKWEKPLGVPPYIFGDYVLSSTPKKPVERSLSVKEKQALFLKKKKTHYNFDESVHEYRKNEFDLSSIVAVETIKNDEKEAMQFFKIDLSSIRTDGTEPIVQITTGATLLIKHGVPNYFVERPGALDYEAKLKNFNFKPMYQTRMGDKQHLHFLGVSKLDGPVVVSIEMIEEEEPAPVSARGTGSVRGQSASLTHRRQIQISCGDESKAENKIFENKNWRERLVSPTFKLKNRSISTHDRTSPLAEKMEDEEKLEAPVSPKTSRPPDSSRQLQQTWVLIRTPLQDKIIRFPIEILGKGPKHLLKALKEEHPEFSGIQFKFCRNPQINEDLMTLEQRLTPKGYKIGVLYATKDNKTENCFFSNKSSGPELVEFLEWLGEKIDLSSWNKYDAGLDVSGSNVTGSHSIFTEFYNIPIMFHVSTMIPFEQDDDQQLQRKRHLGNDVVIILFEDSDVDWVFDPSIIRSYFNHVFFVIRKDVAESKFKGHNVYRVAVTYKRGVLPFGPGVSKTSSVEQTGEGKSWLLTKLINAERAAYAAPGFAKAIQRTREILLQGLFDEHYTSGGGGWGGGF